MPGRIPHGNWIHIDHPFSHPANTIRMRLARIVVIHSYTFASVKALASVKPRGGRFRGDYGAKKRIGDVSVYGIFIAVDVDLDGLEPIRRIRVQPSIIPGT
jgi:hypothetical protein